MKSMKTKVFGFAMMATVAVLSSQPAMAGNKLCKVDHYHFGVGSVQNDLVSAKRDAVRAWESFTAFEYGRAWGSVSQSMHAKMNCKTGRAGGYSCNIKAKPCRDDRLAANGETVVEKVVGLFQR